MNTSDLGNRTEAMVLAALVRAGKRVLVPFGDGARYDLVFDENGQFFRVQCKTGRYVDGAVVFYTASVQRDTKQRHTYIGDVEYFGVFCEQLGTVYLVPVDHVGKELGTLRVDPCRNNQVKRTRLAEQYLVL